MIGTPKLAEFIREIESFDIDGKTTTVSFAQRLANEHRWTLGYANRVIREYKRFIILCCVSDRQLTPSEIVDEAWHLHLTYTDSYWNRLVRLLPKQIHHHPTTGSSADTERFKVQFRDTIDLYKLIFSESPPRDIWNIRLSQAVAKRSPRPEVGFFTALAIICGFLFIVTISKNPALGALFLMGGFASAIAGFSINAQSTQVRRTPSQSFSGSNYCTDSGGGYVAGPADEPLFDGGDFSFGGDYSMDGSSSDSGSDGGGGDGGGCGGGCGGD